MIERYALVSGRIRAEMGDLNRVVERAIQAMQHCETRPGEQSFLVDAAALNLHDFYTGLERLFQHIALNVDRVVPEGRDWHRELLRQMSAEAPGIRPAVLSPDASRALDEYLRFRHIVRNVYAFEFDPDRVWRLVERLGDCYGRARSDLLAFSDYLESLARAG